MVQTASHLELKITFFSQQYELAQKLNASSLMFRELQDCVSQIQQALEAIKSTTAHIMWYFCNQVRMISLQHIWDHAHEIILTNGQNRKYQNMLHRAHGVGGNKEMTHGNSLLGGNLTWSSHNGLLLRLKALVTCN